MTPDPISPTPAVPKTTSDPVSGTEASASPRVAALTPHQRDALALLERLGAPPLGADLSGPALKRVFRALALRYHPDRHPASSPDERRRLATAFNELVGAYRDLRGSLPAAA